MIDIETAEAQAPMTAVGAVGQILEEKMELHHGPQLQSFIDTKENSRTHRSILTATISFSPTKSKGE